MTTYKTTTEVFKAIDKELEDLITPHGHYDKRHVKYRLYNIYIKTNQHLYKDVLQKSPSYIHQVKKDSSVPEELVTILQELYDYILEEEKAFAKILSLDTSSSAACNTKAIALLENLLTYLGYYSFHMGWASQGNRVQQLMGQPSEVRKILISLMLDRITEEHMVVDFLHNRTVAIQFRGILDELIQIELPLPETLEKRILLWAEGLYINRDGFLLAVLKNHVEAQGEISDAILAMLRRSKEDGYSGALEEWEPIIASRKGPLLNRGEVWTDTILDFLEKNPQWQAVIEHAKTATMSKPTTKWLKTTKALLKSLDNPEKILEFLSLIGKPRSKILQNGHYTDGDANLLFDKYNVDAARGLAWMASTFNNDETARTLAKLIETSLKKISGVGPRDVKLANAGILSLAKMEGEAAITQLTYLKSHVTSKKALIQIEKALELAAEKASNR